MTATIPPGTLILYSAADTAMIIIVVLGRKLHATVGRQRKTFKLRINNKNAITITDNNNNDNNNNDDDDNDDDDDDDDDDNQEK